MGSRSGRGWKGWVEEGCSHHAGQEAGKSWEGDKPFWATCCDLPLQTRPYLCNPFIFQKPYFQRGQVLGEHPNITQKTCKPPLLFMLGRFVMCLLCVFIRELWLKLNTGSLVWNQDILPYRYKQREGLMPLRLRILTAVLRFLKYLVLFI